MTTRATNATRTTSKASVEKRRANALSKRANEAAASKSRSVPTSFRLPEDLVRELQDFVYSERNVEHLNRTEIVIRAIRGYIEK